MVEEKKRKINDTTKNIPVYSLFIFIVLLLVIKFKTRHLNNVPYNLIITQNNKKDY